MGKLGAIIVLVLMGFFSLITLGSIPRMILAFTNDFREGIGYLFTIICVGVGIFYGVRWAIRKLRN